MDFITSREGLRAHYRQPGDGALRKELPALDAHARRFLERSPFVLIGSSDDAGNGDVTPKGDRPGFVAILDDRTLAIPDRPGNNRLDTWENIVVNPAVGLLFLIPGMNETLRVNGIGRITADVQLCNRLAVDGKPAISALVVEIRAATCTAPRRSCAPRCGSRKHGRRAPKCRRWAKCCATSSPFPLPRPSSTAIWTTPTRRRSGNIHVTSVGDIRPDDPRSVLR
jgi:uncharacterized protein